MVSPLLKKEREKKRDHQHQTNHTLDSEREHQPTTHLSLSRVGWVVVSLSLAKVSMGGLWSIFPFGDIGGWVVVSISFSVSRADWVVVSVFVPLSLSLRLAGVWVVGLWSISLSGSTGGWYASGWAVVSLSLWA